MQKFVLKPHPSLLSLSTSYIFKYIPPPSFYIFKYIPSFSSYTYLKYIESFILFAQTPVDVDCFFVPGWKVHSEMLDDYDLAPSRARLFLLTYTNSIQLLILGTASLLTGSFFWASFSIKPQFCNLSFNLEKIQYLGILSNR